MFWYVLKLECWRSSSWVWEEYKWSSQPASIFCPFISLLYPFNVNIAGQVMPYNLWKMQLPPLNFVLVSKILHSLAVFLQKVLDVLPRDLKFLNLIMSQEVATLAGSVKLKKNRNTEPFCNTVWRFWFWELAPCSRKRKICNNFSGPNKQINPSCRS